MPPDTTYIPGINGPLPGLPDSILKLMDSGSIRSLREVIDSVENSQQAESMLDGPQYLLPEWGMFLVVLLILGLLYLFFVYFPAMYKRRYDRALDKDAAEEMTFLRSKYDGWFTQYNPYYCTLSSVLKDVFLLRTIRFMKGKEFRFHQLPEDEFAIAMISGAAVQLTLGLKNYLMDYFPVIHVIRKEYILEMDKETYYGHVSRSGIYIAWNHFVDGYNDYTDSINVGLHEMAHAVSFDVFLGQTDNHDLAFRARLEDFAEEGRPVFRAMRQGRSHVLDDYAATNFDEFWAVCIETFFENPEEFRRLLPDIYYSIVDLLNQDPLKPSKIINNKLAGYEV